MIGLKKILVPTDFSDKAVPSYIHAQEIAKKFDAQVDFIHVVPTLKYFGQSLAKLDMPLDMDDDLDPKVQEQAEHQIKSVMDDYIHEDHRGSGIVKIGRKPARIITEYAEKQGYDLIVMGSKGHHATDMLRGSITEKVIRFSAVPVFSVDEGLTAKGLNRILVPTDGSELSFPAIPVAMTLAEVYDASITLFHVTELYGNLAEDLEEVGDRSDKENTYDKLVSMLQEYLQKNFPDQLELQRTPEMFVDRLVAARGASSHSVSIRTEIRKGVSAHYAIGEYAADHADAVVMATHGRSGISHFFLGSTAEKVAQHLEKPVLTVRSKTDG